MFKDQFNKMYRNKNKRAYAFAYRSWMQSGYIGEEPPRGELSYMGAQAVRMNLHQMYDSIFPDPRQSL